MFVLYVYVIKFSIESFRSLDVNLLLRRIFFKVYKISVVLKTYYEQWNVQCDI